MAKNCKNCGATIDEANKFCSSCGAEIQTENVQASTQENVNQQTANGQPFVYIDAAKVVEENKNRQPVDTRKKAVIIGAIICFVIGLLFLTLYGIRYVRLLTVSEENVLVFLVFILYIFTLGLIEIVPGIILMIVTIVLTSIGLKSSVKAYRTLSKVLLTLAIIFIVAVVFSLLIPSIFNLQITPTPAQ